MGLRLNGTQQSMTCQQPVQDTTTSDCARAAWGSTVLLSKLFTLPTMNSQSTWLKKLKARRDGKKRLHWQLRPITCEQTKTAWQQKSKAVVELTWVRLATAHRTWWASSWCCHVALSRRDSSASPHWLTGRRSGLATNKTITQVSMTILQCSLLQNVQTTKVCPCTLYNKTKMWT